MEIEIKIADQKQAIQNKKPGIERISFRYNRTVHKRSEDGDKNEPSGYMKKNKQIFLFYYLLHIFYFVAKEQKIIERNAKDWVNNKNKQICNE
jgi:hypothetical protein